MAGEERNMHDDRENMRGGCLAGPGGSSEMPGEVFAGAG
jgi:hypothetical protein